MSDWYDQEHKRLERVRKKQLDKVANMPFSYTRTKDMTVRAGFSWDGKEAYIAICARDDLDCIGDVAMLDSSQLEKLIGLLRDIRHQLLRRSTSSTKDDDQHG